MSGVTVVLDEASPLLARLSTAAQQRSLALVGGRAVGTFLRDFLVKLNDERHKYGRNFYANAARSVTVNATDRGARISVTQRGFRQRLLGGPIAPTAGKKYLTIPAIPEAYGTLAGEWTGLKVGTAMDTERGYLRLALVRETGAARVTISKGGKIRKHDLKGATGAGEPVFWLVRSVSQAADPSVVPPTQEIDAVATAAIQAQLDRITRRSTSEDVGGSA